MHDIRRVRDDPAGFDAGLARRGHAPVSSELMALDAARRAAIGGAEAAQAARNAASKEVGRARAAGDEAEFARLRDLVAAKKDETARLEAEAKAAQEALDARLMELPNLADADVPDGADEAGNVELRRWGTPRAFGFAPREHHEIPGVVPGMDFATAAKLSGSRFVLLRGAVARVHRALAQFMLDLHTQENGLTEVNGPVLVREAAMLGTGQLPKFGEDSFLTREGHWLIPTSEVTLTNTVAGEILDEAALPLRLCAHSLCFRSEAGSAGRDTAGMLRQHQFEKVEMVSVTRPEGSRAELDRMTRLAEDVLERLGLPYRTVVLCAGDMGFGAVRTHDIEVWLPGQDTYREISSCSSCGDFQARRMGARFRPQGDGGKPGRPELVHTLNGSGLAVGRCLIAVLENGQEADGSVTLPEALRAHLGGRGRIAPDGALV
jgi:seryl-tRNA synthetase